jgi:hypothetical protein
MGGRIASTLVDGRLGGRRDAMAGLITTFRDAMNPHERLVISDPDKQKITLEAMKDILKRRRVVTWGWEVSDKRIVFRVKESDKYTAKGVLKEKGVEFD